LDNGGKVMEPTLEVYTKEEVETRIVEVQILLAQKLIPYDGCTFLALMAVAIGAMKKDKNNDGEIHSIFDKLLADVQVMEIQ
jgi:hypothetical protein